MLIDSVNVLIEVQKNGERRLQMHGHPVALTAKITLEELDQLIHHLAQDLQVWRATLAPTSTYYDILGVARDASALQIKKAFRRVARRHHPDLHNGTRHAEMTHVNEAHQILSDPVKRQQYDSSLTQPNKEVPCP